MGRKNTTRYSTIQAGDTFGDWTVVGEVFVDRYAVVPCECKCGSKHNVNCYNLTTGKSSCCKTCGISSKKSDNPSWRGYKDIPQSWFSMYQRYAKLADRPFEITIEDAWDLYESQEGCCALSGIPIDFKNESKTRGQRRYSASIDRIDSNKGYTKDNVQLVHKDVNIMKNKYDQEHFLNICKLITEHSK